MQFSTAVNANRKTFKENHLLKIYLAIFFICWIMTFINTPDRKNWFTENTLTAIFICSIVFTYKKFKFSDLSYTLFFV